MLSKKHGHIPHVKRSFMIILIFVFSQIACHLRSHQFGPKQNYKSVFELLEIKEREVIQHFDYVFELLEIKEKEVIQHFDYVLLFYFSRVLQEKFKT